MRVEILCLCGTVTALYPFIAFQYAADLPQRGMDVAGACNLRSCYRNNVLPQKAIFKSIPLCMSHMLNDIRTYRMGTRQSDPAWNSRQALWHQGVLGRWICRRHPRTYNSVYTYPPDR